MHNARSMSKTGQSSLIAMFILLEPIVIFDEAAMRSTRRSAVSADGLYR